MNIDFPPARRKPFNVDGRRSPIVPVNPVFSVWPVPGSADDPAVQPPTAIPIDTPQVAYIHCGTEMMLVNSGGQMAQYRIASGGLTLEFQDVSRLLEPTERLFINLQLVGSMNGGEFVLGNAFPDMAQVQSSSTQATSLAHRRIEFPGVATPAGTVMNTVGLRVIMYLRDSSSDVRSPFSFTYKLIGGVAVADPIVGPCADDN